MNRWIIYCALAAVWAGVPAKTAGQEPDPSAQELFTELRRLSERVEKLEKTHEADQQEIRKLKDRLGQMEGTTAPADRAKEVEEITEAVKAELGPASGSPGLLDLSSAGFLGGQPITLMRSGASYLNVSFDVLADFGWSTTPDVRSIQSGDHDPSQRGFTIPNAEIAFDGAVDPYFKGFANIVWKLDEEAETTVELEEAYLLTTSLPWNLQAKAGQFFTEFGRHNPQHPHTWAFVDQPLVLGRMFGPEGLRNPGARLSWLAPTPFYTELMLTVQNGNGGTAFSFRNPDDTFGRTPVERDLHGPGDLLYVPRITSSFDLSDTQTLVLGASAAFGPNDTGRHTRTEIYGVDAYWKWRPVNAQQGFPFVSLQTEAMYRNYETGADFATFLPSETLSDWGFYTQLLYGFRRGWVVGLRGDYVNGDRGANDIHDPLARGDRFRLSPNLAWYPTEFSKLRWQYNYDHGREFGDEHSVWTQLEFALGAHGAHKF